MAAETTQRTLDVRDIDGEPFGDIMAELGDLSSGGSPLLINSFEPEPLYGVLTERGFTYETDRIDADEWHVKIRQAD